MNDSFDYLATVNGENIECFIRDNGIIEITLNGSVKTADIKIVKA